MGGPSWTPEEDNDLRRDMDMIDFMVKWNRSIQSQRARRHVLGLKTMRHDKHTSKTPICVYCATHEGECTCDVGHRCRDKFCLYSGRK